MISTNVGGIPDMIENGVSGLLIEPGRPDLMADTVLRLREDAGLRKKLADGAGKAFEDKFEFSRGIEEIRSLYESF